MIVHLLSVLSFYWEKKGTHSKDNTQKLTFSTPVTSKRVPQIIRLRLIFLVPMSLLFGKNQKLFGPALKISSSTDSLLQDLRAWSPPAPARLRSKTVKYQLLTHEHWGRWHLWRFYHRTRSSIRSRFPPPGPSASRGKHNTKGSFKPLSVLKRSCKFKAKWAPKCVPPLFSVIK